MTGLLTAVVVLSAGTGAVTAVLVLSVSQRRRARRAVTGVMVAAAHGVITGRDLGRYSRAGE